MIIEHEQTLETQTEATIRVLLFCHKNGRGHLVEVTGNLSPVEAIRLAIDALVTRLIKRI